ncbi:MAG: c-type cytochrome domain-containing protein [Verrucomicrobiota bacterium]
MESAPATSVAKPIARLRWLLVASLGLGLAVAGPLIDKVAWDGTPPEVAQWIGRFHPFVLHFPIVLLLMALAFEAARLPVLRRFLPCPDASTVTVMLAWGAAGCTLGGVCGWLLAQSGDYAKELLDNHLWAAAATALGANLALIFRLSSSRIGAGVLNGISNTTLVLTCGIMAVAGHYGASLTHGETYLTDHAPDVVRKFVGLKPKRDANALVIKPIGERLLWDDVVQPILEERCNSCHHEGKMKGGLRLDSLAGVLKGGASGAAVVPGNPKDSLVFKRLHLDPDDEKHMPPKGKPQPTEEQITALNFWIENGAPGDKTVGDYELAAAVRAALDSLLTPAQRKSLEAKTRAEAAALETALATLRSRLPGRLACVVPGQPELEYAPGIHAAEVGDAQLNAMAPVAGSVVALELQQTRVTDAGLAALAPFVKLRNLQLQNTALSDAGMVHLGGIAALEVVNLYGTGVTDAGLQHLAPLKHLKKVCLWQSKVTEEGASQFRAAMPGVDVDLGLPATSKPAASADRNPPASPASSPP